MRDGGDKKELPHIPRAYAIILAASRYWSQSAAPNRNDLHARRSFKRHFQTLALSQQCLKYICRRFSLSAADRRQRPNNCLSMLKRCSALVLLSVLLATAASAQLSCEVGVGQQLASTYRQWQSALSAYSEVQTEYSSCAASRPREQCKDKYSKLARVAKFSEAEKEYSSCVESQVRERCKGQYSKLQSAKQNLEAAISEYESWRQNDCVQQPGTVVGRMRPLGLWPVAQPPQE
jgi:hypothetical protein